MVIVHAYLFTSTTCPHCPAAKSFADQYFTGDSDVEFVSLSAEQPEAQKKAMEFGVRAVPTFILVGPGFDRPIGVSGTPSADHMDKLVKLARGEITADKLS